MNATQSKPLSNDERIKNMRLDLTRLGKAIGDEGIGAQAHLHSLILRLIRLADMNSLNATPLK